jgi:hypothetical protein
LKTVKLTLQVLQTSLHDRQGFDCGLPAVNLFLREQARRQMEQRINRTWVMVSDAPMQGELKPVMGYFTLTQCTIRREHMPSLAMQRQYPRYPLPVIKLAWLGVALAHQRGPLRLGETLLVDALLLARQIVRRSGLGVAVTVNPLTQASSTFFMHYGFERMHQDADEMPTLFLPMKTIEAW